MNKSICQVTTVRHENDGPRDLKQTFYFMGFTFFFMPHDCGVESTPIGWLLLISALHLCSELLSGRLVQLLTLFFPQHRSHAPSCLSGVLCSHFRPSWAAVEFLFVALLPCSELLFGRLGQLLRSSFQHCFHVPCCFRSSWAVAEFIW